MATLSDLVEALAHITGLPEATVFAYGRFAREGGAIAQKGRGRGGATMNINDAANLLIAAGATGVTREAADAIRKFRPMRGEIYDFSAAGVGDLFLTWLKPLGLDLLDQSEFGSQFGLKADFGEFLEFLIAEAVLGDLPNLLRKIPVVELPVDVLTEWKRTKSENLDYSYEMLVSRGALKLKPTAEVVIGEDLEISITFVRTSLRVDVEFKRMFDSPETVFQISFYPRKGRSKQEDTALRVAATLTQDAIFGVGFVLTGQMPARALKSRRELVSAYARMMNAPAEAESRTSKPK